jgi:hypothetical protein
MMLTLGDANTRDRDYADVYLLSRVHPIGVRVGEVMRWSPGRGCWELPR